LFYNTAGGKYTIKHQILNFAKQFCRSSANNAKNLLASAISSIEAASSSEAAEMLSVSAATTRLKKKLPH
jgi:hypothetical protein